MTRQDANATQATRPTRRWAALGAVCLAVTVIVMDGSIVNVALPTLVSALRGVTNSQLQWIVDAYILTFAALLLAAGSAADRFGRRAVLLAGLVVFAIMSVGAARSESARQLVAWRTFMGAGAAMIFPSTLAIISDAFPRPGERRAAIAAWAGSSGLGVAIGPVAGGWLLTHFHWGSIFFVNIPLIVLAMLGAALFVRESRDPTARRFDLPGNTLAVLWALTLVWGLIEAPILGWSSPRIGAAFASALALALLFVWWERRTSHPMLDLTLFLNRPFASACLAITTAFFGLFGFVFMVTQYLQLIQRYSALESGVRTLPFAAFILLGALAAAGLGRTMRWSLLAPGGLGLMACGFACVTRDVASTAYPVLVGQMGLLGVGLGLVNAAATGAIMNALPLARAGAGSAVNDTTREIGATLGVAAMGSCYNLVYRADITKAFADSPLPADAVATMRESIGMAVGVLERVNALAGPWAGQAIRERLETAFISGLHAASWLACAASLLGAALVLTLARAKSPSSSRATFAPRRVPHARPAAPRRDWSPAEVCRTDS